MERPARFVAVPLLRHLAAAELSENRDQLFVAVEPIDTYAVVGVGVFRDIRVAIVAVASLDGAADLPFRHLLPIAR